eukprot:CAMPEP_0168402168 /NCGR_PEP_ID=MMETSP0228-20121227/23482_1 /TAXON_ID=133427 /ORGANISM="Protoceratium reticulatum, Strain CCCM 535 (=CCMP 1889)" /LENGTH=592 /DNA_ID=CAMNT_0008415747 /DNA_START=20 /DNA_END=1795 /DNA_ORIENTATION=+
MSQTASWRMHGENSPLFAEYLELAEKAGWGELVKPQDMTLSANDALIVVDMQNDFIPTDATNPRGGAFAVSEGNHIVPVVVGLMEQFAAAGATVVATRDYHPVDHCSFIPDGGPFPPHCIQGSVGSKFYTPIGECVAKLKSLGRSAEVVFKGFHENIDSFGSFAYPDDAGTFERVTNRDEPARLHGCTLAAWTGAVHLKCSNCEEDVNAPPDIMSVYGRTTLADLLRQRNVKRVFACGLAMDFCVMDTALNGAKAGFQEVFMVLDAARAAHLPGIGHHGSVGFLQDPADLKAKMKGQGITCVPAAALLPKLSLRSPLAFQEVGKVFPGGLGPFALVPAWRLRLDLDLASRKYTARQPAQELASLKRYGIKPEGVVAPPSPLTLDAAARQGLRIPEAARSFLWGYPTGGGSLPEQARGYFSITTPSAAFFVFGGFIYLDASNKVVAVMGVSVGNGGLSFSGPVPWPAKCTAALAGRWQPVTAPLLLRKGAKLFAWVNPGEVLKADGADDWKAGAHGGFAYLFHEEAAAADERDVFFAVGGAGGGQHPMKQGTAALGRVGHAEEATARGSPGEAVVPTKPQPPPPAVASAAPHK